MATKASLDELFLHMLQDVYYAENQITKALPKLAEKASQKDLKKAFQDHLAETKNQVKRLEQVFKSIDEEPKGEKCPAIEGLIEEGEELIKEFNNKQILDAGLLAAAQAVEHYEITRYGTLVTFAEQLGYDEAARLLQDNLAEEKHADQHLNYLALHEVNNKLKAA